MVPTPADVRCRQVKALAAAPGLAATNLQARHGLGMGLEYLAAVFVGLEFLQMADPLFLSRVSRGKPGNPTKRPLVVGETHRRHVGDLWFKVHSEPRL